MKQTFSKKPWIPEFFPRGTIVEFDTMPDSEFGTAGVGEVDSVVLTDIDNLVLILKNIVLSKGEELGHDSYSSSHVVRIIRRGNGPVVHKEEYRSHFQDRDFGQRGKVWKYGVASFFRMLMINTPLPSMMAYKSETMGATFLKQHPGEYYPKKQLRQWFKQNRNRFLKSMREHEIAKVYNDLEMEISLSEDMDTFDTTPYHRVSDKKRAIQHNIEALFFLKPDVLHWNVLTFNQVKKRARYGHFAVLVAVNMKGCKFSFYSDNPRIGGMVIDLVVAVTGYGFSELELIVTTSAVVDFIEPESNENTPCQSLYGFVYDLDYILSRLDEENKPEVDVSDLTYDDDGLWPSDYQY